MSNEQINDHFTTHWTGPFDRRATVYAAEKGISYSDGDETTYNMGGVFASFVGSGNTDMN